MGNSTNAAFQKAMLKAILNTSLRKNNNSSKKKNTASKPSKTPYLTKGLQHIFYGPKFGFVILYKDKNGKIKPKSVPGVFAYKNIGYRIVPWSR